MCVEAYRSNNSRAVGSYESRLALSLENVCDADHVVLGDTLSNADNERDLGSDGLLNTSSGDRRWDEDGRGGGSSLLYGVCDGREDGPVQMCLSSLLWVGTTDDVCAIVDSLLSVESTLLASETLV